MTMPQEPTPSTGRLGTTVSTMSTWSLPTPAKTRRIDRDAAAALVAACPECRSEFDLQREVATWMSAAPAVTLSDDERTLLHDRVEQRDRPDRTWSRLPNVGVGASPVRSCSASGALRQPLAVIAGLGGVFNDVGGDNDGGHAFQTVASELAAGDEQATRDNRSRGNHDYRRQLCGRLPRNGRCWLAVTPKRSTGRSKS